MPRILVLYASTHGHTAKIAARIATALEHDGATVDLQRLDAKPDEPTPPDYDAVILGASIHTGHHQHSLTKWAKRHRTMLAATPSAFFSVCLTAADDTDESRAATQSYLDDFLEQTGWTPGDTATFGGALQYLEYDFATRLLVRLLMSRTHRPTDPSQDYDYTDWDAVDRWAHGLATTLTPARARSANSFELTPEKGLIMSKIIVAVDQSQGSSDAITLAGTLAGITGSALTFVNVFPYDLHPSRASNREFEAYLRNDSRELLERLRGTHGDETVEIVAIPNPSPSHGLHEFAAQSDADLIVVGSTHTGRAGRVLPGSTAERLLHGAPCPVAVAPKGYAEGWGDAPATIGVGYDGSPAARHALDAARRIAAATGARVRVIRAFEPLVYDLPPGNAAFGGMASYNDGLLARASEELDAAIASIEMDGFEPQLTVGKAADVLADASEELDLLLVGSRGYGPMHAVLVGGVAGRLVTEAACPVIVFPRGAGHGDDDSLFATTAALQA